MKIEKELERMETQMGEDLMKNNVKNANNNKEKRRLRRKAMHTYKVRFLVSG